MHKIPTISFNDLKSADAEVLEFLTNCLSNNGFFVINEHPIDLDLIDRTFSIAEQMFALPYEVKKQYHLPGTNGARGYTCLLYTSPSPRDATLSRMPSSA